MVAKRQTNLLCKIFPEYFCFTFDERRFDRLIIELRNIVPVVNGRRVTDVMLFSPSGHMEAIKGFLL